jgi:hypothetical protein
MPLTDDDVDRVARRTAYLLAQGLANQNPANADDNMKWLISWINQCFTSCMGAVLDYKLSAAGVSTLAQKLDAAPDAIAAKFAAGITLTVNTTKGA